MAGALVVRAIVVGLEEQFLLSQQANLEIAKRVQVEQQQRQSLEQANAEIETRVQVEQEQREHLQRILLQVRSASGDLSNTAAEILAATSQQMAAASQQSSAISQTTTTVNEVKTIAVQSVSRLSEHTQQIGKIITTMNELASQSNMLALNAAVEAARAGEQGKGFSVVAQEMRSLAEQSKQATIQVRGILEEIQQATNTTVMATEAGTKGVDEGGGLAAKARQVIQQLAQVIDESAQAAMQMVAGGQQQAAGIEQIATAMQNINQATAQGLVSTRQAEHAAQDLNGLAGQLNETVQQYKVG
jgi:methyl-accepting chemotaxis protein